MVKTQIFSAVFAQIFVSPAHSNVRETKNWHIAGDVEKNAGSVMKPANR
jgi:hypothetical protein